MYILAIETTGAFASVAVAEALDDGSKCRILAHVEGHDRYSHLQNLTPQIEQVLSDAEITIDDLSAIAVANGPGSFTGIRIGVSTARALAQAWGKPCVAASSLTSFVHRRDREEGLRGDDVICAILNARRHQVYGFVEGLMKAGPYMIEDVLKVIMENVTEGRRVVFYGDGVDAYESIIRETLRETVDYVFAPKESRYQDATDIALAGLEKFRAGDTVHYSELLPDYMREAEAEQKLKAGELPISRLPKQE
jgi:tRNA threonylcarbamoyladenosine biosynthesis protein TsaB